MLKNLPVHFDDPSFREDALRGVGNTARRIDEMIARLSALRQRHDIDGAAGDCLARLVAGDGFALAQEPVGIRAGEPFAGSVDTDREDVVVLA